MLFIMDIIVIMFIVGIKGIMFVVGIMGIIIMFVGTVGCDANEDGVIDAGDLSCTVLTIFNGPGECGTTP